VPDSGTPSASGGEGSGADEDGISDPAETAQINEAAEEAARSAADGGEQDGDLGLDIQGSFRADMSTGGLSAAAGTDCHSGDTPG